MRVIDHNWSATKQRPHPQSVAEISRHSVLSGDRIRQCETTALRPTNTVLMLDTKDGNFAGTKSNTTAVTDASKPTVNVKRNVK